MRLRDVTLSLKIVGLTVLLVALAFWQGRSIGRASLTRTIYSGQNVEASVVYNSRAKLLDEAEQTGVFRMSAGVGESAGTQSYKMALGAETICARGSAPCWGMSTVLTTNKGFAPSNIQVAHEFDQNNDSGVNCGDVDLGRPGAVPCGTILLTGAGHNQVTFGVGIAGYNQIRNGIDFFSGGPVGTSLRDYSSSQVVYLDTGRHINGLDGKSASYSGFFLIGPGGAFSVTGDGAVTGKSFSQELHTPRSSSEPCRPGQFSDDVDFHYACVSANRWKRVAMSAF